MPFLETSQSTVGILYFPCKQRITLSCRSVDWNSHLVLWTPGFLLISSRLSCLSNKVLWFMLLQGVMELVQETEQKLQEAEQQCGDLIKSFLAACRPCLEDTSCRRGFTFFSFKVWAQRVPTAAVSVTSSLLPLRISGGSAFREICHLRSMLRRMGARGLPREPGRNSRAGACAGRCSLQPAVAQGSGARRWLCV